MINKYQKRPVVIEAVQFTGQNKQEILDFCNMPEVCERGDNILIETLEGTLRADPMDWIIRGVKGEFYPCKPDIFDVTYILVD